MLQIHYLACGSFTDMAQRRHTNVDGTNVQELGEFGFQRAITPLPSKRSNDIKPGKPTKAIPAVQNRYTEMN